MDYNPLIDIFFFYALVRLCEAEHYTVAIQFAMVRWTMGSKRPKRSEEALNE